MKFIIAILLTGVLNFFLGIYLPWWFIAIAAFVVALLVVQRPPFAFLAGFLGIFFCWFILAWARNNGNDEILATKVAHILPLGGSVFLLILIPALIAGIVGGFAAMTASYLGKLKITE